MTVSLLLINPKFAHNVGSALRAASCFGADGVYWTGDRVSLEVGKGQRLPREERMKSYREIRLEQLGNVRPLGLIDGTPVAVEVVPCAEELHIFDHPADAVYVFGPEDGSLPKGVRTACHRFVRIPSRHCLSLAAAAYIVLYDRALKRWVEHDVEMPSLDGENRGWYTSAIETGR